MKNYELILVLACQLAIIISTAALPRIAKPGCKDHCGNISIPYPFGIGPNCYHNLWFELTCVDEGFIFKKQTLNFNFGTQITIGGGSKGSGERTVTMFAASTSICGGGFSSEMFRDTINSINLKGSPFLYSGKHNILLVSGCGGGVILENNSNQIVAGCAAVCPKHGSNNAIQGKHCCGIGCCQTAIPFSIDYYQFNYASMLDFNSSECISAILVDRSSIMDTVIDSTLDNLSPGPVVLEWKVTDLPIHSPSYANSSCHLKSASADDQGGYVCRCKAEFYDGNPYLPHGCQVVGECKDCVQDCMALRNHTYGCPKRNETEVNHQKNASDIAVGLGVAISMGSMLSLFVTYWFYHLITERRDIKHKTKCFERNGGMLLKQQLSSNSTGFEKTRIFSSFELEKATDQYNENRILGHGGQGIVYKGMLSDGKIVAIKKSKRVDETLLNGFINEVIVLSQINHRSVIKLLGCCLETEVPLLIYEYVPNGTLAQNIHAPNEDFPITWEMRLNIATDIASALAYLHSSYSIPIYHRDIKSSNILLDSKYRAKLSDFGISRSLSVDETHITTRVVGTFGYLDPEYFQSNQYTDKSDVYSFGVVLVELLTGQKAIRSAEDDEERGLVSWFFDHMENSTLYIIMDARVVRESTKEDIVIVANLAKRCLNLDGRRRPSMKEVAAELETMRSIQQGLITRTLSSLTDVDD